MTAGKFAGQLSSGRVYHTQTDCRHLDLSDDVTDVTAEEVDRYRLRECGTCITLRISEALGDE